MWTVYMLECKNGALYTGVTTDPERRFKEHQEKSARYTSYNPPLRMVYKQRFISKVKAFRREAAIKKLPRIKKWALAASQSPGFSFQSYESKIRSVK